MRSRTSIAPARVSGGRTGLASRAAERAVGAGVALGLRIDVDLSGHAAREPERRPVGEVQRRPQERAVAARGQLTRQLRHRVGGLVGLGAGVDDPDAELLGAGLDHLQVELLAREKP